MKSCQVIWKAAELERFVRDAASSYWHQTCTAKMGQDAMSVVDGALRVYGIEHLRIVDGSIMPRIATGNTMAPGSSSANARQKSSRPSTHWVIATEGLHCDESYALSTGAYVQRRIAHPRTLSVPLRDSESSVAKTNGRRSFDGREMVAVHDMLRREFALMPGLVAGVAAGDHDRAQIVGDHIEALMTVLHHHHRSEDEFVWPLLLNRCAESVAPLVGLMEDQHERVATLGHRDRRGVERLAPPRHRGIPWGAGRYPQPADHRR